MWRTRWMLGCALLLSATGCGGGFSHTITVSAETLDSALGRYFPLSSEQWVEQQTPVVVTLSEPHVLLEDGKDQLGLKVQVALAGERPPAGPQPPPLPPPGPMEDAPAPGQTLTGSVTVFGEIEYRQAEGAFYVLNPTIGDVELHIIPEHLQQPARQVTEQALAKLLSENAVYTLKDDNLKSRAAKAALKSVQVVDGRLQLELGL